jgi:hypothetical protein
MFNRRGGNYAGLRVSEVPRWFIEHYANAKEANVIDWTMHSFLMLVFNALLFPTDSDKMAGLDYLMCAHLSDVLKINWCQVIIDDIMAKVRDLNNKIASNDKSNPNVQWCIAFLVISFYKLFLIFFLSAIYYLCCSIFYVCLLLLYSILGQAFSFVGYPFYILSAISSCVRHFILCEPFYILCLPFDV